MLKYFNILLVVLLFGCIEIYSQTPQATFVKEVEVDPHWMIWHSYVIDSAWLNVWLPNGDLPRRENGTYRYWKADSLGNLIQIRYIVWRLPLFKDEPVVMKKENSFFENDAEQ